MNPAELMQLKKKSYSVPEIRRMLGLGKTESYWLLQHRPFEVKTLYGQMQVMKSSFDDWYENQVKYKKVDGSPPGIALRAMSYSVSEVFMPKAVAEMLVAWKAGQDEVIDALGSEYQNYNLVFAGALGLPTEGATINSGLKRLIKENDLPPVVFHSFRHSSITYKLKLNGGDIKAVQDDSGHSQVKMVTDVYSHILDDDRKSHAQLFQEAFYEANGGDNKDEAPADLPDGLTPEVLAKILANPEMSALLSTLAKNL